VCVALADCPRSRRVLHRSRRLPRHRTTGRRRHRQAVRGVEGTAAWAAAVGQGTDETSPRHGVAPYWHTGPATSGNTCLTRLREAGPSKQPVVGPKKASAAGRACVGSPFCAGRWPAPVCSRVIGCFRRPCHGCCRVSGVNRHQRDHGWTRLASRNCAAATTNLPSTNQPSYGSRSASTSSPRPSDRVTGHHRSHQRWVTADDATVPPTEPAHRPDGERPGTEVQPRRSDHASQPTRTRMHVIA